MSNDNSETKTPFDQDEARRYAELISERNHPDWPDMVNLARGYMATEAALDLAADIGQAALDELRLKLTEAEGIMGRVLNVAQGAAMYGDVGPRGVQAVTDARRYFHRRAEQSKSAEVTGG